MNRARSISNAIATLMRSRPLDGPRLRPYTKPNEDRGHLSLRVRHFRSGDRSGHRGDMPLHRLPDPVGLGVPHRRAVAPRHVRASIRNADSLCEEHGRERHEARARLLSTLRNTHLRHEPRRRAQVALAPARYPRSARGHHAEASDLDAIAGQLARSVGHARRRRQARLGRLITKETSRCRSLPRGAVVEGMSK